MRYVLSRLIQGIFILLGVSVITFFLPNIHYSPVNLAIEVIGHGRGITRADYYIWLKQNGLDGNIWQRYWHWLWQVLHGNFGISYIHSTEYQTVTVGQILGGNLFRSVWLVTIPTIASVLIAIPIGLSQALRRNKIYDHVMTSFVFILYSTPAFLVCTLMLYYLGVVAHIGTAGISSTAQTISPSHFPAYLWDNLTGAIDKDQFLLPFLAIIFLSIGGLTRYVRGSALDTLVQDYVRTAKAKGAGPTRVLFRHVLRPSVIPLITILGLSLPGIIGGALIIEFVFNYPGMGFLTVQATEKTDFAVVMAITLFTAFLTVLGNLLADIFVAIADPRIRLGAAR